MALQTPPVREPFFDAEIELPRQNPSLPALKAAVRFLRTTRGWANWAANTAREIFYASFWESRTVASDYTVERSDSVILVNADATITLPAEFPRWRKRLTVKKVNATAGAVTVEGDGFTIDGAANWTTSTQYESVDIVGDGTNGFLC